MTQHYLEQLTRESRMAATFTLVSCIRRYHMYKDIWDPGLGESVSCKREDRNPQNPYAAGLNFGKTIPWLAMSHVPSRAFVHCF